jgi:DNA-directed RNA polymerase specialized sigma24 family protein
MTYHEAAGRLATTPQVVRARVSRGLGSLRRQLSDTMETTR